jgi:hypothetical protein
MGDDGGAPGLDAAPQGSSAAATEQQPCVPREGLSLAALRAFADAHAGHKYTLQTGDGPATLPFEKLTTAQVVEAVIKPATLAKGANGGSGGSDCTYAELLVAQARGRGGTTDMSPRLGLRSRLASRRRLPRSGCRQVRVGLPRLTNTPPPLRACTGRVRATRAAARTWATPRASCRTRGATRSWTCWRRFSHTASGQRRTRPPQKMSTSG